MDITLVSTGTPKYDSYPDPNHGTATQIWGLAKVFAEKGHSIKIYCATYGTEGRYQTEQGIKIVEIPTPSVDKKLNGLFTKLFFSRRVAKRLQNNSPDLVLLRERITALFPSRLDIPSIYTVISPDSFDFFYAFTVKKHPANRLLFRYKKVIEQNVLANVDAVGVINEWMKTYLRTMGYPETYYLPMGIPDSDYQEFESKKWDKTIITAGRLEPLKRPTWVLDAFESIRDTEYQLQIIGEGSLRSELESQASNYGISEQVTMPGWIDRHELLDRMHDASILIHPAKFEMGGNVILEGLASGCAVISSDTMGAKTLIDDGETGRLFHRSRPDQLQESLKDLVSKKEEQRRLGWNAHQRIETTHTMDQVAIPYLRLTERLI